MTAFVTTRTALAAAAGMLILALSPAEAGDGNEIRIIQESGASGPGNTLTVDQSGANNSLVTGLALRQDDLADILNQLDPSQPFNLDSLVTLEGPAIQTGGNNTAILTISEDSGAAGTSGVRSSLDRRGVIGLYQENDGSGANVATVDVTNNALGSVFQSGGMNTATLSVTGGPFNEAQAQGAITQNGINNTANLSVTGVGARSALTLNGNDNDVSLNATGSTNINYTLNGNGVSNMDLGQFETAVPGISVFSNATTVTITQTQQ